VTVIITLKDFYQSYFIKIPIICHGRMGETFPDPAREARAVRIAPAAIFLITFCLSIFPAWISKCVYDGQNAQRNHILNDKDIIELHFG